MSGEVLSIEGLTILARTAAGSAPIVDDVSLRVGPGEILGLIGESGAGKSTIGLAALGYTRPGCWMTAGQIWFDGIDLRLASASQLLACRGRRIAYVAQSAAAAFNPAKRLLEQICEAPLRHGLMACQRAEREAIELFGELDLPSPESFGARFPHQVSGGQLQRAMVAMAMSCHPALLVFDEPTTALDVTTQVEVLVSIRRVVRQHRTAALYISHDLPVVAQMADRIMVLRNGKLVEEGGTAQILHRPREPYTRALVALSGDGGETSHVSGAETLLELSAVTGGYSRTVAVVEDINLTAHRGETVAVVGESGSGKSTLARLVAGLLMPRSGVMRFRGVPLAAVVASRPVDVLRRIQMIYQTPDVALNPRQTVGEIVGRPLRFYFGMNKAELEERVAGLLADTDLSPDIAARYSGQLSGGQKQRICIARALAADPDLIICDEITSALDPLVAGGVLDLLRRLQSERGYAYLFITHDLATVRRIAHRVAVMLKGRLVDQGSYDEVFTPPRHAYADRLLTSVPELDVGWLDKVLDHRLTTAEDRT